MSPWVVWLCVACFFIILEIFTPSFLVMWLGVAALPSLLISLAFPEAYTAQFIVWFVFSVILIFLTKRFADRVTPKSVPTNVYSVIGKKGVVITEINNEKSIGQVKVDGDIWSAKSKELSEVIPVDATVEVLEIDGVKVVVKLVSTN